MPKSSPEQTTPPADAEAARARHGELARELQLHNHRYYVLDAPTLSDAAYDKLYRELVALEAAFPTLITATSPTQRVGAAPREGFVTVAHRERMYSLDNAYTEEDLRDFDQRIRGKLPDGRTFSYVTEPKIDGASIEIVYEDGKLVRGITRGDGRVGEDVTESVRTIRALPLEIADTRPFSLRGEVFIHRADLAAVNKQRVAADEEPFANPRNAASGALRLLDSKAVAGRPLRIALYDLVEPYFESHHAMLEGLLALGLPTHRLEQRCASVDEALAYIAKFETTRTTLPYDTDGVVIKVDELALRADLGFTARFPRWATAYKYAAEKARTVVLAITADVGRTGALTPVADLEPTQVSGTVVSRASLHNLDYVATKDVRVGDTVTIQKAGEIIPQVLEVDLAQRPPDAVPWVPPTHCPVCGTGVAREEGVAALRCPNGSCPGRLKAALFHFTRRSAMDVDRIGNVLIDSLVESKMVASFADLFALPARRDELAALERMGEKSADNVIAGIEAARQGRPFNRLLTALGIPHVGTVAAELIAERYADLRTLLDEDPESVRAALGEIHGIGPKIADAVAEHLADPAARADLEALLARGVTTTRVEPKPVVTGPLTGMTFCVTGTLSESREAIWKLIETAGGEIHKSVKKGTTYLVAGDDAGGTKTAAAEKKGTKVLSEGALRQMIG